MAGYRSSIGTVIPLYSTVLHVVYRGDKDPTDVHAFLKGATVVGGHEGYGSRRILNDVLDGLNLTPEDVTWIEPDGELPDLFVVYLPIEPHRIKQALEARQAADYRFLSFGTVDEIDTGSFVDRAAMLDPHLSPFVIPAGTYGEWQPDPVVTLATAQLLVARQDLPEGDVYDLVREIVRWRPALVARKPGLFHRLDGDFDESSTTFALHTGARAYLDRDAPSVYERYSGIAEVVVTVMIGLLTATFALARIISVRRKNRIDEFYIDAIAIRESIVDSSSAAERYEALDKLHALQKRAFELLVREKTGCR